jgi:hypothetical protein
MFGVTEAQHHTDTLLVFLGNTLEPPGGRARSQQDAAVPESELENAPLGEDVVGHGIGIDPGEGVSLGGFQEELAKAAHTTLAPVGEVDENEGEFGDTSPRLGIDQGRMAMKVLSSVTATAESISSDAFNSTIRSG